MPWGTGRRRPLCPAWHCPGQHCWDPAVAQAEDISCSKNAIRLNLEKNINTEGVNWKPAGWESCCTVVGMQQPQGPLNDWWHTRDIVKLPFLLVLESYVLKDYSLEEVKRILIFGLDINLRYKTWMWIWTWTFPVSGEDFSLGFWCATSFCMWWSGGLGCSANLQHSQASTRDVGIFWHVSPPDREIVKCFCLKVVWRLKGSFSVLFSALKIDPQGFTNFKVTDYIQERTRKCLSYGNKQKKKRFFTSSSTSKCSELLVCL